MKSIRGKIILILTVMILAVSVSLGVISCVLNFSTALEVMEETLTDTASVAASQVASSLQAQINIVAETGAVARFSSNTTSMADKKALFDQKIQFYGFSGGGIADINGKNIFNPQVDISGQEYFKAALAGKTYITEPLPDEATGKLAVILASPLWAGGNPGTTVDGVVYYVAQPDFLNNLVNAITIGQHGTAYIIDRQGTTIAYNDDQIVQSRYNTQNEAQKDPSLVPLARLEARMINGEIGFGQYQYGGITKVMAFSPISGTNGWSITVSASRNEFLGGVYRSVFFTVVIIVVFLIIGILLSVAFGGKIAKPVILCADRLRLLAGGDLKSPLPEVHANDETGILADSTNTIVNTFRGIIQDLSMGLSEIANGNFDIESQAPELYIGDFAELSVSMYRILDHLSDTLSQVHTAAGQVSGGSEQVSAGAQALSQGATEQASAVEELAAAMIDISEKLNANSDKALETQRIVGLVGKQMSESNQEMQSMIEAMRRISSSSEEIGKIIKTIEDIAFQTNILALNAAVEAARAGAAGKGFAVVADEVRNLASKSAESSQNTAALIEGVLGAIQSGTRLADNTAQVLRKAVASAQEAAESVNRITKESREQAQAVSQAAQGVDQISSVVQTNSATAEESAASSQELNGQAQMLKELVGKFRLRG